MTWWRRQRVPLIALAVAAIAVHVWLDVLPAVDADEVVTVRPGQSAELVGQSISLTSTRWDQFEAPTGMRALSVLLKASGGDDASVCGALSLTDPATDRVWLDGRALLEERPEGESTCTTSSASYDVLAVFVLPDDASGPFELDMPGEGDTARFHIAP